MNSCSPHFVFLLAKAFSYFFEGRHKITEVSQCKTASLLRNKGNYVAIARDWVYRVSRKSRGQLTQEEHVLGVLCETAVKVCMSRTSGLLQSEQSHLVGYNCGWCSIVQTRSSNQSAHDSQQQADLLRYQTKFPAMVGSLEVTHLAKLHDSSCLPHQRKLSASQSGWR